jgi:Family of unknown function (DUF5335)
MLTSMAPSTREIPRPEWSGYFDSFSRDLDELVATLEVVGEEIGAQTEAENARLLGITYDDKDDILVIGLDPIGGITEELERIVDKPQAIFLETDDEQGTLTFDVEDREGQKTLLRLAPPS